MFHGTRHRVHKTLAFFRRSPADYSNDARHRELGDLALPRAWSPSEGMRSMLSPPATLRRRKRVRVPMIQFSRGAAILDR